MANMSYCRFQNTAPDFQDCVDAWHDDLSTEELRAKARILRGIREVLDSMGIDYDGDDFDAEVSFLKDEIERAADA